MEQAEQQAAWLGALAALRMGRCWSPAAVPASKVQLVAAASLHVGATVDPANFEGTWIAEPYVDGHYDVEHGIRLDGGWMDLPPGPGLGITPDESLWGDPVLSVS